MLYFSYTTWEGGEGVIPKYYFHRLILSDEELCAPIVPQPPLSPLQCYQKRRLKIQQKLDEAIAALPPLAGPDILELVLQREEILRRLDRHGSFWLSRQEQDFRKLLPRILRVTPAMIEGYQQALGQALLSDATLLLDDGQTRLVDQGRDYIAKTVVEGELTLSKCHEILEKLAEYRCFPKKVSFRLSDGQLWDYVVETDSLSPREDDGQFNRKILQLR